MPRAAGDKGPRAVDRADGADELHIRVLATELLADHAVGRHEAGEIFANRRFRLPVRRGDRRIVELDVDRNRRPEIAPDDLACSVDQRIRDPKKLQRAENGIAY